MLFFFLYQVSNFIFLHWPGAVFSGVIIFFSASLLASVPAAASTWIPAATTTTSTTLVSSISSFLTPISSLSASASISLLPHSYASFSFLTYTSAFVSIPLPAPAFPFVSHAIHFPASAPSPLSSPVLLVSRVILSGLPSAFSLSEQFVKPCQRLKGKKKQ